MEEFGFSSCITPVCSNRLSDVASTAAAMILASTSVEIGIDSELCRTVNYMYMYQGYAVGSDSQLKADFDKQGPRHLETGMPDLTSAR